MRASRVKKKGRAVLKAALLAVSASLCVAGGARGASASCPVPTFGPTVTYTSSPMQPAALALTHLTPDANIDAVGADPTQQKLVTMLGNGQGRLTRPALYNPGADARALVAGDFNGNGTSDVATANYASKNLSIMIGAGNGLLGAALKLPVGASPVDIASADVNNDGKLDLLTANANPSGISLFVGNGLGGFNAGVAISSANTPRALAAGDFNGDGKVDVAVAIYNLAIAKSMVGIRLGNGDGTFGASAPYTVGKNPKDILAADLNEDGELDIITADYDGDTVTILLGTGSGTFQQPVSHPVGDAPVALAAGDFDFDGDLDIAVANKGSGTISILMGLGNGTMIFRTDLPALSSPVALASGDLNGDGKLDLLTVHENASFVALALNACPSNPCQQSCAAIDDCHDPGVCDPNTNQCSTPAKPNGTSCNDHNFCTQTDACQAGVCAGSNPKVCSAKDGCHEAGACDPLTGVCTSPAKPDGDACNDGNLCTTIDLCVGGVCAGGSPVQCAAKSSCHDPGACDPATGQCSDPPKPNGSSCNDANLCTQSDTCQAGVCVAGAPITCPAPKACHTSGACSPETGECPEVPKPNGALCDDGNLCTQGDACQGGACAGGNPIVCVAQDECHLPGACNPGTGACSNPTKQDGAQCSIGVCKAGVCKSSILLVKVFNQEGTPIEGAEVIAGGAQHVTDDAGQALISGLPPGPVIPQISAYGYTEAAPAVEAIAGTTSEVVVNLLPRGEPVPIKGSTGGVVWKENVRLAIPANGVVDGNGNVVTGVVGVTVAPLDPNTDDIAAMPGQLVGVDNPNNPPVSLASVYMAEITLWAGGQKAQLAPGKTATVEFMLPDAAQGTFSAGDTIDAWHFDPADGLWHKDGAGLVQVSSADPTKLAWVKQVSHFSWWNADLEIPVISVHCIRVIPYSGAPGNNEGGALVTTVSQGISGLTSVKIGLTDSNGTCLNVYNNEDHHVSVLLLGKHVDPTWDPVISVSEASPATCTSAPGQCTEIFVPMVGETCVSGVIDTLPNTGVAVDVYQYYGVGKGMKSTKTTVTTDATGKASYCMDAPASASVTMKAVRYDAAGNLLFDEEVLTAGFSSQVCASPMATCMAVPDLNPSGCTACPPTLEVPFGEPAGQPIPSDQTAVDVAYDTSGNLYMVGHFNGKLKLDPLPEIVAQGTGRDVFLAKFNPAGQPVWLKRFGDAATQLATGLAVYSNGASVQVVIIGTNEGTIQFDGGAPAYTTAGYIDGFMAKFDADGTFLWSSGFGAVGAQRPQDIAITSSGAIVVVGYFDTAFGQYCRSGLVCESCTGCNSLGGDDVFIMRCNSAGQQCVIGPFGGPGQQQALGVAVDSLSRYIVTGLFEQSLSFGGAAETASNMADVFVAKMSGGLQLWMKRYGTLDNQEGAAVAVDLQNNDVIVAGTFLNEMLFNPMPSGLDLTSSGAREVFLFKLSSAGAPLWSKRFGDIGHQKATDVAVDSAGNILLTGSFLSTITFDQLNNVVNAAQGTEDIFLAKLTAAGNHVWARTAGHAGNYFAISPGISVLPGPVGEVALVTTFGTPLAQPPAIRFSGSPIYGPGKTDFALVKFTP